MTIRELKAIIDAIPENGLDNLVIVGSDADWTTSEGLIAYVSDNDYYTDFDNLEPFTKDSEEYSECAKYEEEPELYSKTGELVIKMCS
jgi:hypothetical protein